MMLSTGKILIVIPHCSTAILLPLHQRILFADLQLKREPDLLTDRLFEFKELPTLKAPFSRYVVDLNRSRDATGEKGVIVTTDFDNRPIYSTGDIPSTGERQERIEKYWLPYHQELAKQIVSDKTRFFFDCHSMRPVGSAKAPDPGEERADIVLSNLGTTTGAIRPEIGHL